MVRFTLYRFLDDIEKKTGMRQFLIRYGSLSLITKDFLPQKRRQFLIWYGSPEEPVTVTMTDMSTDMARQFLIWYGSQFTIGLMKRYATASHKGVNSLYGTVHNSVFTAL